MVTTRGMAETVEYFRLYGRQLEKKARAHVAPWVTQTLQQRVCRAAL
jgi:hypothetical protein